MVLAAGKTGRRFILPSESAKEAAPAADAPLFAAGSLLDICAHLCERQTLPQCAAPPPGAAQSVHDADLVDVRGQTVAKRALEIAAAGGHSLLFCGPPGSGKSMLAARLPGLLPPLTPRTALESAAILSLCGQFRPERFSQPTFRSPHHSASAVALVGGGVRSNTKRE